MQILEIPETRGGCGSFSCYGNDQKYILSCFQSSVCSKIMEQLGQNDVDEDHKQVHIISMESFYKPLSEEQRKLAVKGKQNFDHPGEKKIGI